MFDAHPNLLVGEQSYLLLVAAGTRRMRVSRDRRAVLALVTRPSFVAGMTEEKRQ
jgi:hypothetical protein